VNNFYQESSLNIPATSQSFKDLNFEEDNYALSSKNIELNEEPVKKRRKGSGDIKLFYKSPKYPKKHKAKAKHPDFKFKPQTNQDLDHVSLISFII